jgi:PHD/YefM family antitoxin component YafN of YafNO toxin-antitoxin module
MKVLAAKEEQFLTDAKGKRTGVLLNLDTYERLREAEEELADIHAYDALRDRAHSEIAAGQSVTLTSYRANRGRKAK